MTAGGDGGAVTKSVRRIAVLLGAALLAAAALAGCAPTTPPPPAPTFDKSLEPQAPESGPDSLPPVVLDFLDVIQQDDAHPTAVELPLGGALAVQAADGMSLDPAKWTAQVADPAVLGYSPPKSDGSASYQPGFVGTQAGETAVRLCYTGDAEASCAPLAVTVVGP